jgi:hypothetical protein
MKNEKLELKSVFELSPDEMQELDLQEGEEFELFEGDSDYMVLPNGYAVYFFIWSDKNLVITSYCDEYGDELLEFCEGQDTSISRSGYNTRSEV